jgi:translation initiation factor IF-3
LKINEEIHAKQVRVIGEDGTQHGIMSINEALQLSEKANLDLVEIVPNATPPVCKIIDFGKYRYEQTKREKESKKSQHQVKVKEVKLKLNIDDHDFETKMNHARDFISKGNKVRVVCMFRGREMLHPEFGQKLIERMCLGLEDVSAPEGDIKLFGRSLSVILAPASKKKAKKEMEAINVVSN